MTRGHLPAIWVTWQLLNNQTHQLCMCELVSSFGTLTAVSLTGFTWPPDLSPRSELMEQMTLTVQTASVSPVGFPWSTGRTPACAGTQA